MFAEVKIYIFTCWEIPQALLNALKQCGSAFENA